MGEKEKSKDLNVYILFKKENGRTMNDRKAPLIL